MIDKHFGFGAEAVLQPAKQDYAGLQARQTFYDVNAIYAPVNEKKVAVRLEGGIGGAKTSFSITQSSCVGTAVCSVPIAAGGEFQPLPGTRWSRRSALCDRAHLHPSAVRPALHSQLHHSVRQQRRSGRNDLDRLQPRRSIVLWDRPSPGVVCHSSLNALERVEKPWRTHSCVPRRVSLDASCSLGSVGLVAHLHACPTLRFRLVERLRRIVVENALAALAE